MFDTTEIKVLLLENVNATGIKILESAGYQVEAHTKSLPLDVLKEKIRDVHAIGIRSKTKLSAEVLKEAKKLLVIGCFCIGTNQVDLEYAASHGIAVFNSPFSNSRSVAELILGQIIALARQVGDRNTEMHRGVFNRVTDNCFEVRGKVLGIVGYGHIGSQLSVLAEAVGMKVIFFDTLQIMALGTARSLVRLDELLQTADFVTLHVPETPETKNMIGPREIGLMKPGSYLLNASRGSVVDLSALAPALRNRALAGGYVDVFPWEPEANGKDFKTELQGCPNTLLTPHIGGSTEEAQSAIGVEVATAMTRYLNSGNSSNSVNFPGIDVRPIPPNSSRIRVLNVHQNVPGVLRQINRILSEYNIEKQVCDSRGAFSYLVADLSVDDAKGLNSVYAALTRLPENVLVRLIVD
ncbi:hypothetical protein DFJ74DRAFT_709693 [Hyaloraphidium curvatum]|nr:hypothetical protein DFJ74DRAFT_709693 [Hyaloraphidium curvatum]